MATSTVPNHLLADSPPTICRLEIATHFDTLTPKEKLYAHHASRAAFLGTRVTLRQVSPESEGIYDLAVKLYKAVDGDWNKLAQETGASEEDVKFFVEYAAAVLANLGNYKSFGDQKFVPRIPRDKLVTLAAYTPETKSIFEKWADRIHAIQPEAANLLGFPEAGHVTTYYPDSPTITKAEIDAIQAFMESKNILSENTRLAKKDDLHFQLLKASASKSPQSVNEETKFTLPDNKKLDVVYGDYSEEMEKIAKECRAAAEVSANETQKKMWEDYAASFQTGSLEKHKDSQVHWVEDKGPRVETNIGFIESYRDPQGVRAEWEGLVSVVNEERTKTFGQLVQRAGDFIPRLPWGKDFEKDRFLKPDFTSLEVLTFAGSGIPAGINIPNYDDIRQTIGFKNVSLANVLNAKSPNEKTTFLKLEDLELYEKLRGHAFEVQVGIHELLGHGTGKLLQEVKKGEYNFDIKSPLINPVTGEKVSTWYGPGSTWGSVFGGIAASYEECRAECVAMALGGEKDLLEIFGFGENTEVKGEDVLFVEYLQMARAGLLALEYWDPKSKKWGQAHMQARYSILQSFLSAGPEFITMKSTGPEHDDLVISLDRSKIRSHGMPAVREYLLKLHVFKSTADVANGSKLYADTTRVSDEMAKYRDVVMRKKMPRKQFVMANTVMEGDEVKLREYEATAEGLVRSYAEREV